METLYYMVFVYSGVLARVRRLQLNGLGGDYDFISVAGVNIYIVALAETSYKL